MELLVVLLIGILLAVFLRKRKKVAKEPAPQMAPVNLVFEPVPEKERVEIPRSRAVYARQFFQLNVKDYVAFDTETTGVNPLEDRIVEIAAVRVRNFKPSKTFTTLVNPGCHIPESVSDVNHITDKMIAKAPNTAAALKQFFAFVGEDVLVGHNASRFDGPLLMAEADRCGITFKNRFADSLIMARIYYKDLTDKKLETVCRHIGHKQKKAHRALDDSESVVAIVEAMRDEYKKNPEK